MNHIQVLEQEISRLDGQVTQSLANYNAMLGSQMFAKKLLQKLKLRNEQPPAANINENATNTPNSSIAPM